MADDPRSSPFWPADSPAVTAHINLLQGIITRLANNSASSKTWCLSLVAALLALAGATHAPRVVTFALVPVVIFGFLDARYLAQERAYRLLYGEIVGKIRSGSYRLNHVYETRARAGFSDFMKALISWSVLPVYLGLILAYIVAHCTGLLVVLATVAK